MKTICMSIALLFVMTIAFATTGAPSVDSKANAKAQQSQQGTNEQISAPATSHSGHGAAIMSRAEADSLSVRGDSLMAQSDVGDIKVGAIGSEDLIYILVVILLVVVIIAVVR